MDLLRQYRCPNDCTGHHFVKHTSTRTHVDHTGNHRKWMPLSETQVIIYCAECNNVVREEVAHIRQPRSDLGLLYNKPSKKD